MPPGRIAYWADWHILGLNKDNIGQTHITVSMLFIILMILHLWLNWRSVLLYMKNRTRDLVIFTPETVAGAVIASVVFFGTLYSVAPFSTINNALSDYKDNYEYTIGNPPYGHAELSSLTELMDRMDIDSEKAQMLLTQKGYSFSLNKTVKDIARDNGVKPSVIYNTIKPARVKKQPVPQADGKPAIDMQKYEALRGSGMGMRSVADAAEKCGITKEEALARLSKNGIKAAADETLKDVSEKAATNPMDIYIIIDTGQKPQLGNK